jgi:hypothetical protein
MFVCCFWGLIGMSGPEWVYTETVQRRIRVIKINHRERLLNAQDIDMGFPISLEAQRELDLCKIKKAKIYRATIKVFTAQLSGELERHLTERSLEDPQLRYSLQILRQSGSKLKKFELMEIK